MLYQDCAYCVQPRDSLTSPDRDHADKNAPDRLEWFQAVFALCSSFIENRLDLGHDSASLIEIMIHGLTIDCHNIC